MNYRIEEIEDQLIATLQADTSLAGVNIDTHAGEVNAQTFLDPLNSEIINLLPFIYVQYQGKTLLRSDSARQINEFGLRFRFFCGDNALRSKKEGQRSVYGLLRQVYNDITGKVVLCTPQQLQGIGRPLVGTPMTEVDFVVTSPVLVAPGQDEKIMVNMPGIVVYSADYIIQVLAAYSQVSTPGVTYFQADVSTADGTDILQP